MTEHLMTEDKASSILAILHVDQGSYEWNLHDNFYNHLMAARKILGLEPRSQISMEFMQIYSKATRIRLAAIEKKEYPDFFSDLVTEFPFLKDWWKVYTKNTKFNTHGI